MAGVIGHAIEGHGSDGVVREWTATRTAHEAAAALWAAGVPASPVMSFAALAEDPHLAARQVFIEVEHPTLGTAEGHAGTVAVRRLGQRGATAWSASSC